MEEKVLIKSEAGKNWLLIFAAVYFLVGTIYCMGFAAGFEYVIYLWDPSFYVVWPTIILVLVSAFFSGSEIVITNKRAYGKVNFIKRVDLPIDSISAVGTSLLNGVSVATSSGKLSFFFIKNKDDIHKCVSDMLIERQNKVIVHTMPENKDDISNVDQIKKYKELLDSGIITQEEFEAKKKHLLGL